jgi:hypothetical protein
MDILVPPFSICRLPEEDGRSFLFNFFGLKKEKFETVDGS